MRLQLSLRATRLPSASSSDTGSGGVRNKLPPSLRHKPTTFAVVSVVSDEDHIIRGRTLKEIGRTEVVHRCHNPEWATVVLLCFDHGVVFPRQDPRAGRRIAPPCSIAVEIFHDHHRGKPLQGQQFIIDHEHGVSVDDLVGSPQSRRSDSSVESNRFGSPAAIPSERRGRRDINYRPACCRVFFDLGSILERGEGASVSAKHDRGGEVFLRLEESAPAPRSEGVGLLPNSSLVFQLRGLGLPSDRFLLTTKPNWYCEIRRKQYMSTGDTWGIVHRSLAATKSSNNPVWQRTKVDLERFCNYDLGRPVKVSVLDCDGRGNRRLLGSFETTVSHIIEARSGDQGNADTSKAFLLRDERTGKVKGSVVVLDALIDTASS